MTREEQQEMDRLKSRIAELEKAAVTPKNTTKPDIQPVVKMRLNERGVIPSEVLKGPNHKPFASGPVPMDGKGNIVDRSWEKDEFHQVYIRRNSRGETIEIVPMSSVVI